MEHTTHVVADFIATYSAWAALIILAAAFGESLAFLSLQIPGTVILLAAGALLPRGILPVWPVLIAVVVGAILGDGISYWIGWRFGHEVHRVWPFTKYSELIPRGIAFFKRHGQKSVFIGRFFGPVRAVIPLAAGIRRMQRALLAGECCVGLPLGPHDPVFRRRCERGGRTHRAGDEILGRSRCWGCSFWELAASGSCSPAGGGTAVFDKSNGRTMKRPTDVV
ncbi:MAG: DedA family protein [Alphaproteobacteria bacterium]